MICAEFTEQRENTWQLRYDNTSPHGELQHFKISHSGSSWTLKERGGIKWCGMWWRVFEGDGKCEGKREVFQEFSLSNCSVAHTSCGENRGFAEKEDHMLLRRRHFNSFVASRSHRGLAEVKSLSKEKPTSYEGSFLVPVMVYSFQFWKWRSYQTSPL